MTPFSQLTAVAIPLDTINVDTDQLAPIQRLIKLAEGQDYSSVLFYNQRFDANGEEDPDFVLNRPPFRSASILVANANFGCGSSREMAVWALRDYGFRAVVAPSFGDIFFENCAKSGVLAIHLDDAVCADLRQQLFAEPGLQIHIDLPAQCLTGPDGALYRFNVDPLHKECLVRGIDDMQLTMDYLDQIEAWEKQRDVERSWAGGIKMPS